MATQSRRQQTDANDAKLKKAKDYWPEHVSTFMYRHSFLPTYIVHDRNSFLSTIQFIV